MPYNFFFFFFNLLWLELCFAAITFSSNYTAGEITPEVGGLFLPCTWGASCSRKSFYGSPINAVPICRNEMCDSVMV